MRKNEFGGKIRREDEKGIQEEAQGSKCEEKNVGNHIREEIKVLY